MIKPCPTCSNAHDPANECREAVPVIEQLQESLAAQPMTKAEVIRAWMLLTHAYYGLTGCDELLLEARMKLFDEDWAACRIAIDIEQAEVANGWIEVRHGYKRIRE